MGKHGAREYLTDNDYVDSDEDQNKKEEDKYTTYNLDKGTYDEVTDFETITTLLN